MSKILDKLQYQTIRNRRIIDMGLRLFDLKRNIRRKRAAAILGKSVKVNVREFQAHGYLPLNLDNHEFENKIVTVLAYCKNILNDLSKDIYKNKKDYLRALLKDFDFEDHPEILELAFNKDLVSVVAKCLNDFPVLANLALFYSAPNTNEIEPQFSGSQLFHMDEEDTKICKFWLLIEDVSESDGPTVVIRKNSSTRIANAIKYKKGTKIKTEEKLLNSLKNDDLLVLTGKAGETYLLDTASVFHYGSRVTKRSNGRYLLMFSYTTSFNLDHGLFGRKSRLRGLHATHVATKLTSRQSKMLIDSAIY